MVLVLGIQCCTVLPVPCMYSTERYSMSIGLRQWHKPDLDLHAPYLLVLVGRGHNEVAWGSVRVLPG